MPTKAITKRGLTQNNAKEWQNRRRQRSLNHLLNVHYKEVFVSVTYCGTVGITIVAVYGSYSIRYRDKGIDLVAMVKRDGQKYLWGDKLLTIKQIYRRSGKWQRNTSTGIMYKSVVVAVLDKQSANKPESQTVLGYVRMCFFRYPHQKKFKALICTDLNLGELEILSIYLRRWSIEVVFKDLKQHFGFNQSKSSKYAYANCRPDHQMCILQHVLLNEV